MKRKYQNGLFTVGTNTYIVYHGNGSNIRNNTIDILLIKTHFNYELPKFIIMNHGGMVRSSFMYNMLYL